MTETSLSNFCMKFYKPLGQMISVSGINGLKSIDCSPEHVDLLIGVTDYDFVVFLLVEYIKHGRIHILTFVYRGKKQIV